MPSDETKLISVKIPASLLKKIEELKQIGAYNTTSEIIRRGIFLVYLETCEKIKNVRSETNDSDDV